MHTFSNYFPTRAIRHHSKVTCYKDLTKIYLTGLGYVMAKREKLQKISIKYGRRTKDVRKENPVYNGINGGFR